VPQTNNFLFKSLNNEQLQAVKHVYGPLLVVAGAGSGKTKALTHRIANLIENNSIDPHNILAVTFTNKAAKEMKARLEVLLAQELAYNQFGQPWSTLKEIEQNQLRINVNQERLQNLWIGTFHSLFSRLLRYDIEKYNDPEGLKWTRQFSIYDETDSQTLVKEIISQDMNLAPKRYDPKKIKRLISNAKNQCLTSNDLSKSKRWFDKYGVSLVFWGRLVPGIRTLISVPAGMELMPLRKFLILPKKKLLRNTYQVNLVDVKFLPLKRKIFTFKKGKG